MVRSYAGKIFYAVLCAALIVTAAANSQSAKKLKSTKAKKIVTNTETKKTKDAKGLVVIETTMGNITIQLFDDKAPKHAANFRKLAREGFYNGTTFHRVIPGFMIQGGDPNSKDNDRSNDGMGGPGYTIEAEIGMPHDRGVVGAARQGDAVNPERRSNGSQFYITVAPAHFLDGQYTVFGKVVDGMDVADKIVAVPRDQRDNPLTPVVMKKVYVK
ncbi:MAG: peptidylprolyl isomerase [Bacteroidota bacterium]|nr:peptidylprolyl isomerase [Bacteroidota bacterium]